MKIALSAALALCAPLTLLAVGPDSAYQALRTVGAQRGDDALKHVIEVEGRDGIPEPAVWRVVLDDPSARGGIREIEVSHGQIISEHTPVQAYGGSPQGAVIDFHKLNLDSSGAFSVIEKQAEKAHIGFDSVDYILRTSDTPDASPIWVIDILDQSHHDVGTVSLGADTGVVISSTLPGQAAPGMASTPPPMPPDYTASDSDNVYATGTPPPGPPPDDSDTEDSQGLHIGHRIKQVFLSAGQSLKNFVTGKDFSSGQ
ncbi:MAG: hypothetical protein ABSE62_02660 [Chthoniobacteraceae bacterium]|jgi:hypothetical protein